MKRELVRINVVPHASQRYSTWGDWQIDPAGSIQIDMSELSDERYLHLGAIHEYIEVFLCKTMGISQESVDAFDTDYEKRRVAGITHAACGCAITNDPGMDQHAPYLVPHVLATQIEYGLAHVIGVDAATYDRTCATETEPFEK